MNKRDIEEENLELKARIKELEYYIEQHFKAKGWKQELEK